MIVRWYVGAKTAACWLVCILLPRLYLPVTHLVEECDGIVKGEKGGRALCEVIVVGDDGDLTDLVRSASTKERTNEWMNE